MALNTMKANKRITVQGTGKLMGVRSPGLDVQTSMFISAILINPDITSRILNLSFSSS